MAFLCFLHSLESTFLSLFHPHLLAGVYPTPSPNSWHIQWRGGRIWPYCAWGSLTLSRRSQSSWLRLLKDLFFLLVTWRSYAPKQHNNVTHSTVAARILCWIKQIFLASWRVCLTRLRWAKSTLVVKICQLKKIMDHQQHLSLQIYKSRPPTACITVSCAFNTKSFWIHKKTCQDCRRNSHIPIGWQFLQIFTELSWRSGNLLTSKKKRRKIQLENSASAYTQSFRKLLLNRKAFGVKRLRNFETICIGMLKKIMHSWRMVS